MSVTVSEVFVKDMSTGQLIKAALYDEILPKHIDDFVKVWAGDASRLYGQHGHWDWEMKCKAISASLSYRSFALEANGVTQGLMIVNTTKLCRIPTQQDKHLVYIDFLETAPWNENPTTGQTQFKRVGPVLLAAAIQLSLDDGNEGRIGLHSLPQADDFYRIHCGMTDLGSDVSKQNLSYFEMTAVQAAAFRKGGK